MVFYSITTWVSEAITLTRHSNSLQHTSEQVRPTHQDQLPPALGLQPSFKFAHAVPGSAA